MVCLYHSAFILTPFFPSVTSLLDIGQEGVYVFFVISGMVMPWSMEKIGYRISDFFTFLAKRIVRLQPPLVLAACIIVLTSWKMFNTESQSGWELLAASATLTAPLFNLPWVNNIYWTLFVEMQYYIYIAIAYPLLTHSSIMRRSLIIVLLLALSFTSYGMAPIVAKSNLPFHMPVFLMGYYLFMRYKGRISELEFWIGMTACTAACALLVGFVHHLGFRIVATATTTALIIRFTRKGWKLLSSIGEVSYSLYLMHWPIISTLCFFMNENRKTGEGSLLVFGAIQIIAVLFAFLFYYMIEKPALAWSKRITFERSN